MLRLGPRLLLAAPILLWASVALARGGGGHSYSGGSRSYSGGGGSSGGGGDGFLVGLVIELCFAYPQVGIPLLVIGFVAYIFLKSTTRLGPGFSTDGSDADDEVAPAYARTRGPPSLTGLEALRQDDPDFSEPLFLDFVAALVARSVATFRTPRATEVDRYLAGPGTLTPFSPGGWQNVVVG